MRNRLCRRAAFLFIIGIAALISSGCANQQRYWGNGPTLSPQEIQLGAMCSKYSDLTPVSPSAYAECYNNPTLLYPKLPGILAGLSGRQLCAMPKPEGEITNQINRSIRKRKIDCARIAREDAIKAIKTEDTPSLCQAWSSRSAGDLQNIVDSEVKKRGVRCELILSQIQQQQMFQQQQFQQQQMFRQQQLQQAMQANQQYQIQRQQNMLMQQQMMQRSFRNNSLHCTTTSYVPGMSNTDCN